MSPGAPTSPSLPPLVLGATLGALVAGRIDVGLFCLGITGACAIVAGARLPGRPWLFTLCTSLVLGWAINLFFTPGRALAGGWPVLFGHAATEAGLLAGALLSVRVLGAFAGVLALAALWPGDRAADQVARWLGPLERVRVPVGEARAMVGLALRFAPLLSDEARRIGKVQALRAGRPPRGLGERLTRLRAATVPTLVSALERAERVGLALDARHFRVALPAPDPARPSAWGWASRAAGVAVAGVALLWRS